MRSGRVGRTAKAPRGQMVFAVGLAGSKASCPSMMAARLSISSEASFASPLLRQTAIGKIRFDARGNIIAVQRAHEIGKTKNALCKLEIAGEVGCKPCPNPGSA